MLNDKIMMVKELAEYLKITEKTACRFVFGSELPGLKVGNAWRFKKVRIDKWIEKQSQPITNKNWK